MRRLFFFIALGFSLLSITSAQNIDKAIGLRLGTGFGYGAEISYQQPLGHINRLELDLGLNSWGFGLNGVYQWVWDLSALGDGFNWYAGVGAGIGSYNFKYLTNPTGVSNFNIGILGQVGLEYRFEIPLTLSLDYRPGLFWGSSLNSSYDGISLGARYRF